MNYCRINLLETSYSLLPNARLLSKDEIDIKELNSIYTQYCRYKKFKSVMPIFEKEYLTNDIIGYYDNNELVAFSLIGVYDNKNIENYQFAWTYHNPKLKLGYQSIKHECAFYKNMGFKYLYLGETAEYKKEFTGYEELGGMN